MRPARADPPLSQELSQAHERGGVILGAQGSLSRSTCSERYLSGGDLLVHGVRVGAEPERALLRLGVFGIGSPHRSSRSSRSPYSR